MSDFYGGVTKYWRNAQNIDANNLESKYTDSDFQPNISSLLSKDKNGKYIDEEDGEENEKLLINLLNKTEVKLEDIEWQRISEITRFSDNTLFDKNNNFDLKSFNKGNLENIYFIEALSNILIYPQLITQIFKNEKLNANGYYELIFFIEGEWQIIPIDDYLPVNKNTGNLLFIQPNENSTCFYYLLLEKAYAKVKGGYSNILNGQSDEVFQTLTGFYSEIKLHKDLSKFEISNSQFFQQIHSFINNKNFYLVSSSDGNNYYHIKLSKNYKDKSKNEYYMLQLINYDGINRVQEGKIPEQISEKFENFLEVKEDGLYWTDIDNYVNDFQYSNFNYFYFDAYLKTFIFDKEQFYNKALVLNFELKENNHIRINEYFSYIDYNQTSDAFVDKIGTLSLMKLDKNNKVENILIREKENINIELTSGNYILLVYLYICDPNLNNNKFILNFYSKEDIKVLFLRCNYLIKYDSLLELEDFSSYFNEDDSNVSNTSLTTMLTNDYIMIPYEYKFADNLKDIFSKYPNLISLMEKVYKCKLSYDSQGYYMDKIEDDELVCLIIKDKKNKNTIACSYEKNSELIFLGNEEKDGQIFGNGYAFNYKNECIFKGYIDGNRIKKNKSDSLLKTCANESKASDIFDSQDLQLSSMEISQESKVQKSNMLSKSKLDENNVNLSYSDDDDDFDVTNNDNEENNKDNDNDFYDLKYSQNDESFIVKYSRNEDSVYVKKNKKNESLNKFSFKRENSIKINNLGNEESISNYDDYLKNDSILCFDLKKDAPINTSNIQTNNNINNKSLKKEETLNWDNLKIDEIVKTPEKDDTQKNNSSNNKGYKKEDTIKWDSLQETMNTERVQKENNFNSNLKSNNEFNMKSYNKEDTVNWANLEEDDMVNNQNMQNDMNNNKNLNKQDSFNWNISIENDNLNTKNLIKQDTLNKKNLQKENSFDFNKGEMLNFKREDSYILKNFQEDEFPNQIKEEDNEDNNKINLDEDEDMTNIKDNKNKNSEDEDFINLDTKKSEEINFSHNKNEKEKEDKEDEEDVTNIKSNESFELNQTEELTNKELFKKKYSMEKDEELEHRNIKSNIHSLNVKSKESTEITKLREMLSELVKIKSEENSFQFQSKFHKHPLSLCITKRKPNYSKWECQICNCSNSVDKYAYYCTFCNFNLCTKCQKKEKEGTMNKNIIKFKDKNKDIINANNHGVFHSKIHSSHSMTFSLVKRNEKVGHWICCNCKKMYKVEEWSFYCSICNVDICCNCKDKEDLNFNSNNIYEWSFYSRWHHHPLTLTLLECKNPKDRWKCYHCGLMFFYEKMMYYCSYCNVKICESCKSKYENDQSSKGEPNAISLKEIPKNGFDFQIKLSLHEHPLTYMYSDRTPSNSKNKKYKYPSKSLGWDCDKCKRTYSDKVWSYYCTICDYDLCKYCCDEQQKLDAMTSFPFQFKTIYHPHGLTLLKTDRGDEFPEIDCNVCKKVYSTSDLNYYCSLCDYDLCIECKKKIENGKFNSESVSIEKNNLKNAQKNINTEMMEFQFKSKLHKHPLTKSLGRKENEKNNWKCNKCKKIFKIKSDWSYYCTLCDFDLCVKCKENEENEKV